MSSKFIKWPVALVALLAFGAVPALAAHKHLAKLHASRHLTSASHVTHTKAMSARHTKLASKVKKLHHKHLTKTTHRKLTSLSAHRAVKHLSHTSHKKALDKPAFVTSNM